MEKKQTALYRFFYGNIWRFTITMALIPMMVYLTEVCFGWDALTVKTVLPHLVNSILFGLFAYFHTRQEMRLAAETEKNKRQDFQEAK